MNRMSLQSEGRVLRETTHTTSLTYLLCIDEKKLKTKSLVSFLKSTTNAYETFFKDCDWIYLSL